MKPRVIIESPLAGDVDANVRYARECLADSLRRGEAPFASHLLYTQVLDDLKPEEREIGMSAGLEWYAGATLCAVYSDRGISGGMLRGIAAAEAAGIPVVSRTLSTKASVW